MKAFFAIAEASVLLVPVGVVGNSRKNDANVHLRPLTCRLNQNPGNDHNYCEPMTKPANQPL